ncbi:hypothetical protein [Caballeronia cordobensis]|uniref:hypothetical protein n=1 Tax=Caballeronia cordobensis TaxID=1353886 RepID=UPI0006AD7B03|nr:hypothetical protein [Caballeronia cordobensis]
MGKRNRIFTRLLDAAYVPEEQAAGTKTQVQRELLCDSLRFFGAFDPDTGETNELEPPTRREMG